RHATGLTPSEVAAGLDELVRRRVVRELGGRFDFGHDRVREAVYGRLLGPRRTLLHHQVAQALETVYATDLTPHYSAVGTHYRHAAAWTKACDYLTRAGYQARERGAGREALACFEDALQALTQIPDTVERTELRVRLHLSAHAAIVMTTSPEQGRAHLHDAEKLADSLPDRRWAGRVAAALSYSYRPSGEFAHARSHGQRALDVARETGDHWHDAVARLVLGSAEYNYGNFRQSVAHQAPLLTDQTHDEDVAERFFPLVDTVVAMRDLARRV